MGAKSDKFCLFSAYFCVFSPDLWMKNQVFISIVDISANWENIDIYIDIYKATQDMARNLQKNAEIQKSQNSICFGIQKALKNSVVLTAANLW